MVPSSGLAVWAVCLVSCVVSAASSPVAAGLTAEGDDKTWTVAHNKYRCLHGGPYLTWNQWVADSAQEWSNKLKSKEVSGHSKSYKLEPPQGPAGENLAWGYGNAELATHGWYKEYDMWLNTSQDSFSSGTGHFTAMVWKGVRQLGCGTAERTYTCRYKARDQTGGDTPNMGGNFATQVPQRGSKSEEECEEEAEYMWYLVSNYTTLIRGLSPTPLAAYLTATQMDDQYTNNTTQCDLTPQKMTCTAPEQPITAEDFGLFVATLGISQGDGAKLLAMLDRDEDGDISYEEFAFVADDGLGGWAEVDDWVDTLSSSVTGAPHGFLSAAVALVMAWLWMS
mmetsp:Transcript_3779/g.8633  ORF Transcript_3779/g.8633 Transcript_3779/m.8633 type:complete len:338 (-) Transcript_3779:1408-2421(-)